jgi:hypothetical protein
MSRRRRRGHSGAILLAPTPCNDVARSRVASTASAALARGAASVAPSGVHGSGSASRRSSILLELGLGGKFQAKSGGWDENRTFLEGDVLEVEYAMAARVLTHVPAGPRPAPPPAQHYFPTEE